MGSHLRRVPIAASVALHATLFGYLAFQWSSTASLVEWPDQPVAMVFEAVVAPAPEAALPIEAIQDPPAEPVTPEPPPEPPAEPAPAAAEVLPAPVPQAVLSPAAPPPLPRPKPVAVRPPRPAPPVASAPPAVAAPASKAPPPPAAAPVVTAAPSPPTVADPGWRAALGSWLAAHKRYPERARQRGDEGTVGIRFTVDASGRVLDVAITRSSGSTLLDDAARDMLAGQRVPPFPPSMALAQATVPVNVRFELEQ